MSRHHGELFLRLMRCHCSPKTLCKALSPTVRRLPSFTLVMRLVMSWVFVESVIPLIAHRGRGSEHGHFIVLIVYVQGAGL